MFVGAVVFLLSKSTNVVVSIATTSTDIIVVIVSLLRFSCVIDFIHYILLFFNFVVYSINYFGVKNQMFLWGLSKKNKKKRSKPLLI